ncbi:MAG: hypothetical protein RRA92_03220 [Gemmatimonadota bacterium]|nr:hypothetical protein [Gemmatimonadota bacterium]
MAVTVKMSSKNQIVVPRAAREALGLRPGDRLAVTIREGGVIEMRRLGEEPAVELEGILADSSGRSDGDAELWPEVRGE